MRKTTLFLLIAACLYIAGTSSVSSQQKKNTMTNNDVVALVRAGLAETTIILAIEESDPQFDTATETLTGLGKIGVSENILEAMRQTRFAEPADPPVIATNEVFLIDGKKRIFMNRGQTRDRSLYQGFIAPLMIKSFMVFDGNRSQLRVSDRTPQFEASLAADVNAEEKLVLVKLMQKSDRREVNTDKHSLISSRDGFRKEAVVPTTYEPVTTYTVGTGARYTLYRVSVVDPLPPGEYAFVPRHYRLEYYDFGID